jgi:hypothetical protein
LDPLFRAKAERLIAYRRILPGIRPDEEGAHLERPETWSLSK